MILEELHLRKCHMQGKQGVKALFVVCRSIRELVLEDCWGLDDSVFAAATIFSRWLVSRSFILLDFTSEDLETVCCFLERQDIKELPRNKQKPEMLLLVSGQASEKMLKVGSACAE
ncbi:hypothetical protein SASPL_137324 [Salvia splendens]|uniref:F-box and leucine-rich repeat protein 2/20 n=1 Tax=Salvia splendens TaxID=180675 RepID=A0A8X8ZDB0_SALSN|nr:hypothetical protein SASPL_137324 [Salvia splendens]